MQINRRGTGSHIPSRRIKERLQGVPVTSCPCAAPDRWYAEMYRSMIQNLAVLNEEWVVARVRESKSAML